MVSLVWEFQILSMKLVFSAATMVADSVCFRAVREDLATLRVAGLCCCSMLVLRCSEATRWDVGTKAFTPATQATRTRADHFILRDWAGVERVRSVRLTLAQRRFAPRASNLQDKQWPLGGEEYECAESAAVQAASNEPRCKC
jgi:hypothetical protein